MKSMMKCLKERSYDKLLLMIMAVTILTSCNGDIKSETIRQYDNAFSAVNVSANKHNPELNSKSIASICIKDFNFKTASTNQYCKEYTEPSLINEFYSLLKNQKYTKTDQKCDRYYRIELFDENQKSLLEVTFGSREISFNRDCRLGETAIEKGTYEVENWVYLYSKALYEGAILDPEHLKYPAKIQISDDSYSVEIVEKGNYKINPYEVCPQLYNFVSDYFFHKEFEIVESKRIYDPNLLELEISKTKNTESCILMEAASTGTCLNIVSENRYDEKCEGDYLVLSKSQKAPNLYQLIASNMIFYIRVEDAFDTAFQAIFNANRSIAKEITPEEIKELVDGNKLYYMDYISRNLGIEDFHGRTPDNLEVKQIKLDNQNVLYTVLTVSNPFDLRMLIFKPGTGDDRRFVGCIDFGGHMAGNGYALKNIADKTFIVGNKCKGHGTGESRYFEEWYTANDEGEKLVLSFPYDEYREGPYGGYSLHANSIEINTGSETNISVNYDIRKRYFLDVAASDAHGMVEVAGNKTVVFKWDNKKKIFVSEYATNEKGSTDIPPECRDITKNCDNILEKYSDKLDENIKSIPEEQNEDKRNSRIKSIEYFLNDCTDSDKKTEISRALRSINAG